MKEVDCSRKGYTGRSRELQGGWAYHLVLQIPVQHSSALSEHPAKPGSGCQLRQTPGSRDHGSSYGAPTSAGGSPVSSVPGSWVQARPSDRAHVHALVVSNEEFKENTIQVYLVGVKIFKIQV